MLKTADIIEALTGVRPVWAIHPITDAVVDSRQVQPGSMFVSLPGEHVDGHDFVEEAFHHGAHIALVQQEVSTNHPVLDLRSRKPPIDPPGLELPFCIQVEDSLAATQTIAGFWRRKQSVRVIGITGSVGKSTTKEVVSDVLSQRYYTLKNQGNLNNEIGLPLTLLSLGESHERAVLEMGFYVPGEIAFLCDLALPEIGVITNIGTVHAERAGSQEIIARGKAELVEKLPPAPKGVAILNYDDPWVRSMAEKTQAKVFFYGMDPGAEIWADRVESLGLDGIRFRLHFHHEVLHLRIPMIGHHSVQTALRATAVGLVENLTWQEILNGLRLQHEQLRLVAVHSENGALIIDDTYNASPESMLAALNLLAEMQGRKIAVLGDMLELGQYERSGHKMVGVRAAQVVNELVTVGEKGRMIAEAARSSGFPSSSIIELEEPLQAVDLLKGHLSKNDVVLVKGSHGLRMERIVTALEAEQ